MFVFFFTTVTLLSGFVDCQFVFSVFTFAFLGLYWVVVGFRFDCLSSPRSGFSFPLFGFVFVWFLYLWGLVFFHHGCLFRFFCSGLLGAFLVLVLSSCFHL